MAPSTGSPTPGPASQGDGLRWIAAGVFAWGVLLAIGSTGWWTGVWDWRRALFVIAAFGGFLTFWWAMVRGRRGAASSAATAGGERRWSRSAGTAAGLVLLAGLLWWVAIATWPRDPTSRSPALAVAIGWLSFLSFAGTFIAALVALSDPRRLAGKWLAAMALLALAAALVEVFLRA